MSEMLNMLQNAVTGRSPIVYVFSPEEERILRGIREIAAQNGTPVITWSCVRGLDGEDAATQSPVEAIKTIIAKDIHGMIVMCDLAPFLNDNKTLRAIREAYNDGRAKGDRTIFLVCAENIVTRTKSSISSRRPPLKIRRSTFRKTPSAKSRSPSKA